MSLRQELVTAAIATRLKTDPDDSLHSSDGPWSRRARRAIQQRARESWSEDAYLYYSSLLRSGFPTEEVTFFPFVEIPPEIAAIPVARRRLFPPNTVARWAFLRRQSHASLAVVAAHYVGYQSSPAPFKANRDKLERAERSGDLRDAAYYEALVQLSDPAFEARSPLPPDADTIRRQVNGNRRIWEAAEREFEFRR